MSKARSSSYDALSTGEGPDAGSFFRSPTGVAYLLASLCVASVPIWLLEFTGYYWLVSINWNLYVSYDKRFFPALAFGILAASVMLLAVVALFIRRRLLPHRQFKMHAAFFSIVAVLSWYFLVLSYGENLIYPIWVAADIVVFLVILGALIWRRNRISKRSALAVIVLAMAVSLSLAVPGYLLSQRTALWPGGPLGCNTVSCPFGVADPTSPGPPFGELLQGRIYDFYFDVIQGRAALLLTASPGTGNTTYWEIGGTQGLSHWNGIGVDEFEWSPGTTDFYQIVFLNQNYPSGSLIVIRVTIV